MIQKLVRMGSRWHIVAALAAMIVLAVSVFGYAQTACPFDWSGAQSVHIANNETVALGDPAHKYRIHVSVARDFSLMLLPRIGSQHPLNAVATVAAATPAALEGVSVACIRLRHGDDEWARRPPRHETPVVPHQPEVGIWGSAGGGPEWPVGDAVDVEVWLVIRDQRYTFLLGSLTIERAG